MITKFTMQCGGTEVDMHRKISSGRNPRLNVTGKMYHSETTYGETLWLHSKSTQKGILTS